MDTEAKLKESVRRLPRFHPRPILFLRVFHGVLRVLVVKQFQE
jgi:hypothetical protein